MVLMLILNVSDLVKFSGLWVMMFIELVVLFFVLEVWVFLCILMWLMSLEGSSEKLMLWLMLVLVWFSMN